MATVYGAYMSPLEREVQVMMLESDAEYRKICAMEQFQEAVLDAEFMRIESQVLMENGTEDDLMELYIEAQQQAKADNVSLLNRIINWFSKQLNSFSEWLSKAFGGKRERLAELKGKQVTYKKSDKNILDAIKANWSKVVAWVKNTFQQLSQKVPTAVQISLPALVTFGLGIFTGKEFEQNKQNAQEETADGAVVEDTVNTSDTIISDSKKLIKDFAGLKKVFENTVKLWKQSGQKAVQQQITAKQKKADTDVKKKANEQNTENPEENKNNVTDPNAAKTTGKPNEKVVKAPSTETDPKVTTSSADLPDIDGDIMQECGSVLNIFFDVYEADETQTTGAEEKPAETGNAQNGTTGTAGTNTEPATEPASGTVTEADFTFADKALVLVRQIINFLVGIWNVVRGASVSLWTKVCSWIRGNNDQQPVQQDDEADDTDTSDNTETTDANAEPTNASADLPDVEGDVVQEQSTSKELFGFDLETSDIALKDTYTELAEMFETL